jgi:site-specific DNA recombinase
VEHSEFVEWAFENRKTLTIDPAKTQAREDAVKQAEATVEEAQAHLASLVPVSDVHERILEGSKLMGFSDERPKMWERPDGEWEDAPEEISEQATARFREALSQIIESVVVLPPTGKSPRDPERDFSAEVKVIPRKL